ncbi:TPA: hypothetical protein ACOEAK_003165 [Enterobacter ludwigii]
MKKQKILGMKVNLWPLRKSKVNTYILTAILGSSPIEQNLITQLIATFFSSKYSEKSLMSVGFAQEKQNNNIDSRSNTAVSPAAQIATLCTAARKEEAHWANLPF